MMASTRRRQTVKEFDILKSYPGEKANEFGKCFGHGYG
jgi:hypothetical protein